MKAIIPVVIIATVIIVYIILYYKKKTEAAKVELKQAETNLAVTVLLLKDKIAASKDSTVKNVLATAELGGNIVGCFYGYCGGGSATIGQITKRIK